MNRRQNELEEIASTSASKKIDCSWKALQVIPHFQNLTEIKCLNLSNNKISSIECLRKAKAIQKLNLEDNCIDSPAAVQSLKLIQQIDMSNNLITSLSPFLTLTRLKVLKLRDNKIKILSRFDSLLNIQLLDLSRNQISAVQKLSKSVPLKYLDISYNSIASLPSQLFSNLPQLMECCANNNCLTSTSPFCKLKNCQKLQLSHNSIQKIQFEDELWSLEYLNLSHNLIIQIPILHNYFPQLIMLDLSHNYLPSQSALIQAIAHLQNLNQLYIQENPLMTQEFPLFIHSTYGYDFINGKLFSEIGTNFKRKFNELAQQMKNQQFYQFSEVDKILLSTQQDNQVQELLANFQKGQNKLLSQQQFIKQMAQLDSKIRYMKTLFESKLPDTFLTKLQQSSLQQEQTSALPAVNQKPKHASQVFSKKNNNSLNRPKSGRLKSKEKEIQPKSLYQTYRYAKNQFNLPKDAPLGDLKKFRVRPVVPR